MRPSSPLPDTTGVRVREHDNALNQAAEQIEAGLQRHFWVCGATLVVFFLVCSVSQDIRMKMWNDEIRTLYVAQQGSPRQIVKATEEGMDATPPLYPLIVSAILSIVRPDALAVRLPSTFGVGAMVLFILAFCRRRMPAPYAFVAALVVVISTGFYATEGRCYGMVLGCTAGALFCWQVAAERRPRVYWLILLAVFLMLATALHYYSIFLLLPLGLGELARWREHKRSDIIVVAAMLPCLGVLALHYPLIGTGRRYLSHFWGPGLASWRQIPDFYLEFALIPAALIVLSLILLGMASDSPALERDRSPALRSYETLAIAVLALTPIFMIVVSKYTTHVFLSRYALFAAIGLAIGSAAVLCRSARRQPLIGALVLGALICVVAAQQFVGLHQKPLLRQSEAIGRALQSLPDGPEPIVVAYNHAFMELSYYAEPRLRDRLVYLLSQNLELHYNSSDLDYLLLSSARGRTRLDIEDLGQFLATHRQFILAARPEDYLSRYLAEQGYRVLPLSPGTSPVLYHVEQPAPPGAV